jgi:hypothetical protein
MVRTGRMAYGLALLALWLAMGGTAAVAQAPIVSATTDRSTLRENESFSLTLRAEGPLRDEPDLAPLERDFDILQRASSTRVQIMSGRTTRVNEWVLQLMPHRAGRLTVPAIDIGGAPTTPIELEVLPAPDSVATADVFVEIDVDPPDPYVQAEVTYTLRLYAAVSTGRATLTAPDVIEGDAIIERLTDDREYDTVLDGRAFRVRERRYVIFPQSTGTVTIGPVVFEATVMPSRGFARVQRVRSRAVELDVRAAVPPPLQFSGASWLPARAVTLTEQWQDDAAQFVVGVPRTRTIVIEADGLQEAQLPELAMPRSDDLRHYPGQAAVAREYTDQGLRVRRQEPFAVIAQTPGAISVPAVELPWWNVNGHRWEVARLPASSFEARPGNEPQFAAESAAPLAEVLPMPASGRSWWPLVSAALFVAWIATLALLWRVRTARADIADRPILPAPRALATRKALKRLLEACSRDDVDAARRLLLEWGALRFPADPPHTLGGLAARLPADLAGQIEVLQAQRYGRGAAPWEGARLAAALRQLHSFADGGDSGRGDPLLPLYR